MIKNKCKKLNIINDGTRWFHAIIKPINECNKEGNEYLLINQGWSAYYKATLKNGRWILHLSPERQLVNPKQATHGIDLNHGITN